MIKPTKCETRGINTDNINNNIKSIIPVLNLINNIISPIKIAGVVITKPEYTFDSNIVLVLTGSDLRILRLFPSKLTKELVIDVI